MIRRICDRHHGVGSDGILWGTTSPPTPLLRGEGLARGSRCVCSTRMAADSRRAATGCVFLHAIRGIAACRQTRRLTSCARRRGDSPCARRRGCEHRHGYGAALVSQHRIGVTGPACEVVDEEVTVADLPLRIVGATIGNPHCVVSSMPRPGGAGRARRADRDARTPPGSRPWSACPSIPTARTSSCPGGGPAHAAHRNLGPGAEYTPASGTSSCAAVGAASAPAAAPAPSPCRCPAARCASRLHRTGRCD